MSDHDDQLSNSLNDMKNKVKNQNAKRQYGCPCGKQYLSYPALFTHIKQKHGGKAPGQLKKPKTQKARGRPRLPTVNMQEDNSVEQYDPKQQLRRILARQSITYTELFQPSNGHKTCQDMATIFLNQHALQQSNERRILTCFVNYMRQFTIDKYDQKYWAQNDPHDIIDISNQMVRQLDEYRDKFPISRQLLIELLFVLFRWMYKNKWTDHKLVKRASDPTSATNV